MLRSLVCLALCAGVAAAPVHAFDAGVVAVADDRVAELEKQIEDLRKKNAALEKKLKELETRLAKVEAELKPGTPTKNFDEAVGRLDISEAEKSAVRSAIVEAKKAILEVLETPTEDGRVPAEEIIDAFIKAGDTKKEEDNQKAFAVFLEFNGKKLPGDKKGRTYGSAMHDIKKACREKVAKLLSEADQKRLDQAHQDWTEFEMGEDDPFGPVYLERLEKYQKGKK